MQTELTRIDQLIVKGYRRDLATLGARREFITVTSATARHEARSQVSHRFSAIGMNALGLNWRDRVYFDLDPA